MKKLTKTTIASLVVASMMFSFASCALFDKSAEQITEVTDEYFSKLIKGKDVSKLVESSKKSNKDDDDEDEDESKDASEDTGISEEQQAVLDAILENASYEIKEVTGSKKDEEGSATVEFTYVDAEALLKDLDDADADALVDAIGSAKDKEKETNEFELDFVLDEEDWLVKAKSDNKVQSFIAELVDEIEFSAFKEANLKSYIDTYYSNLKSGDIQAALDMTASGLTNWSVYGLPNAESEFVGDYDAIYGAYFSAGSYEIGDIVIEDTTAYVTVKGTVSSLSNIFEQFANDHDAVANVVAGVLYTQLSKTQDTSWVKPYLACIKDYASKATLSDYETKYEIRLEEDGSFKIYSDPKDIFPDWTSQNYNNVIKAYDNQTKVEIYTKAMDQLLSEGKVTQEQYDAYLTSIKNQFGG